MPSSIPALATSIPTISVFCGGIVKHGDMADQAGEWIQSDVNKEGLVASLSSDAVFGHRNIIFEAINLPQAVNLDVINTGSIRQEYVTFQTIYIILGKGKTDRGCGRGQNMVVY